MIELWDRIDAVLKKHAPLVYATLRPPATENQIAEAETLLELKFPEEIRAAYLRHDGQVEGSDWVVPPGCPTSIFHWPCAWCNLEQLKAIWSLNYRTRWQTRANHPDQYPEYDPSWDELEIRPVRWDRKRIPIGISPGSWVAYVDLNPAPRGLVGQIIRDDDMDDAYLLAPSLNAYLSALVDALESGEIVDTKEYGFIGGKKRCHIYSLLPTVLLMEDMPVPPSTTG
jgi:cell wall assembly regulator SMI1